MNKQRIILLLLFITSFVSLRLLGKDFSIGIAAEMKNEIYTLVLSCPPLVFVPYTIWLTIFIYAVRANFPKIQSTKTLSLKRRFLSFLIDFPINLLVIGVPITLIALIINWLQTNEFSWVVYRPYNTSTDKIYFVLYAIQALGVLALFGFPISHSKQSVGGIITNTIIESKSSISLLSASLRSLVGFLTLAAGAISIPWAWLGKDKRMWHDSLFDTFPKQIIEKDS